MNRAEDPSESPADELRRLAPAYALGSLDEPDRTRFERALATSPELQADVDAFRAAATHLADPIPPVAPPPGLKADLFARLDDVVQEPAPGTPTPGQPDELASRRARRRLAVVLSAAAAAAILIAGVVIGSQWPGPNGWGAQRELAALTAAPDVEQATTHATGGGTVTLVWSAAQGRSAVLADGLPDLGDDRTYELWYIDDAGAASAGTFDVNDEDVWRLLEGEFAPGVVVGITVEPAGGSKQPTTAPVAVIAT